MALGNDPNILVVTFAGARRGHRPPTLAATVIAELTGDRAACSKIMRG
jgi:hypothetical protein